ncbi:hypothetical protein OPT61_g7994 [Boeremia exigua]|uniref:Uncharacterized protein n=1 Tax=Boeremia exigua TaxID=749465 RepID=A0ACC2HZZ7_9PLEO|nr:hypothetical protein OPT61_g7994 [Boeremia exigua]
MIFTQDVVTSLTSRPPGVTKNAPQAPNYWDSTGDGNVPPAMNGPSLLFGHGHLMIDLQASRTSAHLLRHM